MENIKLILTVADEEIAEKYILEVMLENGIISEDEYDKVLDKM